MELMSLLAKLTLDKDNYDQGIEDAQKKADELKMPDTTLPKPDNKQFEEGLTEAENTGVTFKEIMGATWKGIKDAIITTGIVGIVSGIVGWMKQGIALAIDNGKAIGDGAKNLQISTKAYQEYEYALGKSGIQVKDLSKAMDGLGQILSGDLTDKQKKYIKNLEEAGLAVDKTASKEENLSNMMKTLADYQGDDKGAIIDWLFGKNQNWTGFFDQTSAEIDGLKQEANDMGHVMSDESIQNATRFKETTEQISQKLQDVQRAFGELIVPALADAVGYLNEFIDKLNPTLNASSIYDTFKQINEKTLQATSQVDAATVTAKKLIEDLQQMGDYWTLDEQGRMTWDALADRALELFPQLSDYIETDGKKIQGNTKDIEANIDAWARLEKQRLLSAAMDEKRAAVAKQLMDAYEKGADAAVKMDDAEALKPAAYRAMENFLSSDRGRSYREALEKNYGYAGTMTDEIYKAFPNISSMVTVGEGDIKAWQDAIREAENLRKESEKMVKEAEDANSKLDDYAVKLAEQMGLTKDDIVKADEAAGSYVKTLNTIPEEKTTRIIQLYEEQHAPGMAIGGTIPWDNYPALLHRGERVLTATEVRKGEGGGGSGMNIAHLEDKIAAAVRAGLQDATVNAYLDGDKVTRDVSERLARENGARRYG